MHRLITFLFVKKIEVKETPVIYIANHGSWKDVFVLHCAFPRAKIMAAAKIMNILPIGLLFKYVFNCYVVVPGEAIDDSLDYLDEGTSIIICPEGWAYLDGRLRPFKTGAAVISRHSNRPIVPLYLKYEKYHSSSYVKLPFALQVLLDAINPFFRIGVEITVGEPIPPGENIMNKINNWYLTFSNSLV